MLILALDSSTDYASVCLHDATPVVSRAWRAGRRQTQQLAPAVDEMLALAGVHTTDVDAIAVGLGPGSYTGIRVALALAKGIAVGLERPLVGVSTLEVLAYGVGGWPGTIVSAMPTGRDRVGLASFTGPWSTWRRLTPERALTHDAAVAAIPQGALLCGPAADELARATLSERAPRELDIPDARYVAVLARRYFEAGGQDQTYVAEPLYLRASSPEERRAEASARG